MMVVEGICHTYSEGCIADEAPPISHQTLEKLRPYVIVLQSILWMLAAKLLMGRGKLSTGY